MNSELRQDIVSGDWIIIAPGRAKRPESFVEKQKKRVRATKRGCPFESLSEPAILNYPNEKKWELKVVENKYPALAHQKTCSPSTTFGLFKIMQGAGHHDLIITRDHNLNFPNSNKEAANLVFQSFRDRYLMLYTDSCINYISFFHNWGPGAGASIYHPHYQMIALPVVPPDVAHSLRGSANFFAKHKKCVHCEMIRFEREGKLRVIAENEGAIAFCPFVSRQPFEIRVFPKKHLSYFENTYDNDMEAVVEVLQKALKLVEKNLRDPDYNFFIHTSPLKDKESYNHYHWHIEVVPKISIPAGFELGTGVDINVVDPDEAAKIIRGKL